MRILPTTCCRFEREKQKRKQQRNATAIRTQQNLGSQTQNNKNPGPLANFLHDMVDKPEGGWWYATTNPIRRTVEPGKRQTTRCQSIPASRSLLKAVEDMQDKKRRGKPTVGGLIAIHNDQFNFVNKVSNISLASTRWPLMAYTATTPPPATPKMSGSNAAPRVALMYKSHGQGPSRSNNIVFGGSRGFKIEIYERHNACKHSTSDWQTRERHPDMCRR